MLEAAFHKNVVELATMLGWRIHHDRRQDLSIGGDAGFPDLVLARDGRIVFAELKTLKGRLTPAQVGWLEALTGHAGFGGQVTSYISGPREVYVWRPADIDRIGRILGPRAR